MSCCSFPVNRTSAGPEASQKAMPNFMAGLVATIASWRSSTVLIKCDCPRMKFISSGFSMGTLLMSMEVDLENVCAGTTITAFPIPNANRRRDPSGAIGDAPPEGARRVKIRSNKRQMGKIGFSELKISLALTKNIYYLSSAKQQYTVFAPKGPWDGGIIS